MASSKEYLEFVLEQLAELDEITYRAMMGEWHILIMRQLHIQNRKVFMILWMLSTDTMAEMLEEGIISRLNQQES